MYQLHPTIIWQLFPTEEYLKKNVMERGQQHTTHNIKHTTHGHRNFQTELDSRGRFSENE